MTGMYFPLELKVVSILGLKIGEIATSSIWVYTLHNSEWVSLSCLRWGSLQQ